jgi:rhodanese-related sulfurtransferase
MQVAFWLERNGFDDVINLHGGIDAWSLTVDSSVPRY